MSFNAEVTKEGLAAFIDELVKKNTFSLEVLNQVNTLRERAASLESEVKNSKSLYESVRAERDKARASIVNLTNELTAAKAREDNLVKREKACHEAEKELAVAKAESRIYGDVFNRIFQNRIVRENVTARIPVAETCVQPGGSSSTYHSDRDSSESRSRVEE